MGEGQEEGDIKSLQGGHKIWDNIKSAAAKRKSWQSSSKYTLVISNLPETCFSHHGYHVSCYRRFTSIPTSLQPVKAKSPGISSAARKSSSRVRVCQSYVYFAINFVKRLADNLKALENA